MPVFQNRYIKSGHGQYFSFFWLISGGLLLIGCSGVSHTSLLPDQPSRMPGFPHSPTRRIREAAQSTTFPYLHPASPSNPVTVLQGLADGTDSLGNAASQIQISAQVCQVSPKEDSAISSVLTASRIPLICAPTMQRPMPSSFQLHSLPLISLRGAELVLISVSTISGVQNPILLPFQGSTFGVQLLWFLSWTLHTQNVS